MNNNTLSTCTTINEDYMLFPYNDHNYSSQTILPFSPSSSLNEILIHSTSNTPNNLLDHHNNQFSKPSPFSQFEFGPDFASFLQQNNGQCDNQTIPYDNHHPPSLLVPLNHTIGDQPLEPLETITHIEDSQRSSASQDPKMKKIKKPNRMDRHSKIKTAKGTRDRRMRLSLDVARELFGLQDMLGFDKASKTVEWLLTQAKPEILKVAKTLPHHFGFSSGDESQTRSALGSKSTTSDIGELASMGTVDDSNIDTAGNKVDGGSMKGKTKRLQKRTPILKKLSKDQRAQARERAKDRTKEKMTMKRISQVEAHDHGHEIIKNCKSGVNWISFDETTTHREKEIAERCKNCRFEDSNVFLMNKKDHISEESYDIINKFNSSFPMLSHLRNPGAASSLEQQQHRFKDLRHLLGKPRDLVYNCQNMF